MTRRTFFRMFGLAAIVAPVARVVAGQATLKPSYGKDRHLYNFTEKDLREFPHLIKMKKLESWEKARTSFQLWREGDRMPVYYPIK